MAIKSTVQDLPNELLKRIFTQAKEGRADPVRVYIYDSYSDGMTYIGDPNDTSPNEAHPLFKSLRLVSKYWNSIAMPPLFETIVLYSHVKSWESLDCIANIPRLAKYVKAIHVATIKHLPHYGSLKTYRSYHEELLKWEGEYRRSRPNGGPFANLHRSDEAFYERYLEWCKGERVMAKHRKNGTLPKLRLNLLPNLQTIKTIGRGELAVIKREYNRKPVCRGKYLGPWRSYPNGTRREIETMVPDEYGRDNDDPAHLEMFILALDASGKQVQSLALRNSK